VCSSDLLEVNNIKVVVTEFPTPPNDPGMFVSLGIDLNREKILVEKGGIAWKTGLNITPGKIIYVDTPGLCNADLNLFHYKNLNRPVYPFDDFDPDLEKLIYFFKNNLD
jgi:microcystin degradation protein MlrC